MREGSTAVLEPDTRPARALSWRRLRLFVATTGEKSGLTFKKAAFFVALLLPVWSLGSEQAQIVTGTRTGAGSVRLALPEFQFRGGGGPQGAEYTRTFNETLWDDLDFSGVVNLVSRSFYPLGRFGRPIDIDATAWTTTAVDAQFVSFGNATVERGNFVVESRLWDLKTRIEDREAILPGQRFRVPSGDNAVRQVAHEWADMIIEALGGGIRGVSKTKIAFVSDRTGRGAKEIFVMDYDGHNQFQLTTVRDLALTPSWSPDGERIAFTSWERNKADVAIVSRIDRRGFAFPEFEGTTTTPSWSADGTRLAFSSSMGKVRGQPDPEIYVSDSRGRNLRRLTTSRGVDTSPVWNPRTGEQIAFVSDRDGSTQIYIVDAQGGNVRQIVRGRGSAVNPAWSPDGQTIAFAWQKRGTRNYDIYLHDLASGRNVQLTQNVRNNERPTWSPDGRHLAFESNRGGRRHIYSMLADGTKVRQLTNEGNNVGPAWSGYIGRQARR